MRRNIIDIEAAERDLQKKLFRKVNTICRSVVIINYYYNIILLPIESELLNVFKYSHIHKTDILPLLLQLFVYVSVKMKFRKK